MNVVTFCDRTYLACYTTCGSRVRPHTALGIVYASTSLYMDLGRPSPMHVIRICQLSNLSAKG